MWSARNGQHPLNPSWPRRFLVNKKVDASGPLKRHHLRNINEAKNGPARTFSLEGFDGVGIPYGGKILMQKLDKDELI